MKQKRLRYVAINNEPTNSEFCMVYDDGSFANFQSISDQTLIYVGGPNISHLDEMFWTRRGWDLVIKVQP